MSNDDTTRALLSLPPMTKEREEEEFALVRAGDFEARNRVVEANMRMVVLLAQRFDSDETPFDDLVQSGALALCEAAQTYEGRDQKGGNCVRFATYAYPFVRHGFMQVMRQSTALTLPRRAWSLDDPVGAELLKVLSIDSQSPETEEDGVEEVLLRDLLEEVREGLPERGMSEEDTRQKMRSSLARLTKRQRAALFMRFWEGRLFREIGPTKQAGEQIVQNALAKLRALMEQER